MMLVSTIRSGLLFLGVVALLAAADRPHEASAVFVNGDVRTLYVFAETFDGMQFAQDPDADKPQGSQNWDRIQRIDYADVNHLDYARGLGAFNQGDPARAAELFAKVVADGRTEHTRVEGVQHLVTAHKAAGQTDAAVQAIDDFVSKHPEHPVIVDLLYRKGLVLMAGDRNQAAAEAFVVLGERAGDFGDWETAARAKAAAGRAEVQLAQDAAAKAAETVEAALAEIDREEAPTAYAQVGIIGVRALQQQEEVAGAQALASDIQFLGDDLAVQVEAQLRLARLLAESDPVAAFDHAAIAALRGPELPTGQEARSLAKQLAKDLSEDENRTADERQAYKDYHRSL